MKEVLKVEDIKHDLENLIRGFERNNYMFEFENRDEKMESIFSHKTWLNAQICFARIIGAISSEEEKNYENEVREIVRKKIDKAW